jgi:hypothetical protein
LRDRLSVLVWFNLGVVGMGGTIAMRWWLVAVVGLAVLVAVVAWPGKTGSGEAKTQSRLPTLYGSGLVTVKPTDDVRLHVVAAGVRQSGSWAAQACTVEAEFADRAGETLARDRAVLRTGQGATFDLRSGGWGSERSGAVRGLVELVDGQCVLVPTLEVMDEAGDLRALIDTWASGMLGSGY